MKVEKSITYFTKEGQGNMESVFELAKERALEAGINKILIFSANGHGALKAAEMCEETSIDVYAVTFPYQQKFYLEEDNEDTVEVEAGIVDKEVKEDLKKKDVKIIQGVMPFQDIIIPDAKDVKLSAIMNTLSLFGGGMHLCVEAIIMAFEEGVIDSKEDVIACSADTAILANGSFKRLIFSPYEGLEIKEIICKPRNLTLTREGKYNKE